MTKKNKALLPTTSEPEDNPPTDVATGVPTPGINAEVANESAGETTVPVNETEVTAPDAAPKSAKKKGGLPIHADYELSQVMLKTVEQQTSILWKGVLEDAIEGRQDRRRIMYGSSSCDPSSAADRGGHELVKCQGLRVDIGRF